MSHNRYISASCGGAISQTFCTKFGKFVDFTDIITSAKFVSKIFIGFSRPRGRKTHFLFRNQMAYITVSCATALAFDNVAMPPCPSAAMSFSHCVIM